VKQRILYAALAALALPVATSAAAETVRITQAAPAMLPAHEIATIVRSTGLNPLSPAVRRGESYVLRAVGPDGREMRVVVDARYGEIMSIVPVVSASRSAPPGARRGPYESTGSYDPIAPDGYVAAGPATVYQSGPPIVYEGDRPLLYERRPMSPIPNAPPPRAGQNVAPPDVAGLTPPSEPRIMTPERGEHGLLPPPPERFPQRAAPQPAPKSAPKSAAKPAPVKRAAAASATPLPKPRPGVWSAATTSAPPSAADASPMPPAIPESKPGGDASALPH